MAEQDRGSGGRASRPAGRALQRAAVLRTLMSGPQTQTSIIKECDLSQPVLTRVMHALVEDGLVQNLGKAESTGGRRPTVFGLRPESRAALGMRLRRRRLEVLVVDLAGAEIYRSTTRWRTARLRVADIAAAASHARASIPVEMHLVGMRVAVPGVVDPRDGTVSQAPDLGWRDRIPLQASLTEQLGIPVAIDNDVNLMCTGEHDAGALAGSQSGAMLYVGEGIGAAVMVDGRPQPGTWGAGAEVGLVPVGPGEGAPRLEDVYSVPAIALRMGLVGSAADEAVGTLIARAAHGDPTARALASEIVHGWAFAVTVLALISDPDRIVVSGALCALDAEHLDLLRERVASRIPSPMAIEPAQLGEDAVLHGAASAALRDAVELGLCDTRPVRRRVGR